MPRSKLRNSFIGHQALAWWSDRVSARLETKNAESIENQLNSADLLPICACLGMQKVKNSAFDELAYKENFSHHSELFRARR